MGRLWKIKNRDERLSDSGVTQKVMRERGRNGVELAWGAASSKALLTVKIGHCLDTSKNALTASKKNCYSNYHRKEEAVCPKLVLSSC